MNIEIWGIIEGDKKFGIGGDMSQIDQLLKMIKNSLELRAKHMDMDFDYFEAHQGEISIADSKK